ncbi:MAG: hypothetical protein ACREO5_10820 [Candidatus Binatia bacterium]
MHRRTLIFGPLAVYATGCRAAAWALITKEEFEREESLAATQPLSRSIHRSSGPPDAPVIEVNQPDATRPIKPPVTIRVHFRPKEGATIDVTSFRVTYGLLAVDITTRIMAHALVSASGLSAYNADVPAGHHRVTLQIADNMHRVGIRTFDFTVL